MGLSPSQRGGGVLDGRGEGVLGGEPVVDGQHVRARVTAEHPAQPVVGIEVADHEATAVEVHDQRRPASRLIHGSVMAGGQGSGDTVDPQVLRGAHRDRPAARDGGLAPCRLARLLDGELLHGLGAAALEQREGELHLGLQLLPVDDDRRTAGEKHLHPRRERREDAGGAQLEALASGEGVGGSGHRRSA